MSKIQLQLISCVLFLSACAFASDAAGKHRRHRERLWQVFEFGEFEKNELCVVLQCKPTEVCIVKERNAFCVEKEQLQTESLQALLNTRPHGEIVHDVKKTNIESYAEIKEKWEKFLKQSLHQKKKNHEHNHKLYVHKQSHDENFEMTAEPPTEAPLVDRHDVAEVEHEKDCSHEELNAMSARMLKWFGDIHEGEQRSEFRLPHHRISCLAEVGWMFGRLDGDQNGVLSPQELWSIEHDQYEPCLRQVIDRCDQNADQDVNVDEWCDCFQYSGHERDEPPCHKARHDIDPHLIGAFLPRCDVDGYYRTAQCHEGICWCVDRWGREFPNSKVRAEKPDCGQYNDKDDSTENEL